MNAFTGPMNRRQLLRGSAALPLIGLLGSTLAFAGEGIIRNDTIWRDTTGNEVWCNGGHIIPEGGVFYWFSSGLVGWNSSATMYSTATNLAGPWSDLKLLRTDPPSTDSYNTQHDFIVAVAGSAATTYVYVGDRYSQWTKRGLGRNIFLPLVWDEGEPRLRWQKDWRIDVPTGRHSTVVER
jgi:hypothetical protein